MKDWELKELVSSCLKKRRYSSVKSAMEAIIRARKNNSKDELRIYFCSHCLGYHLTHKFNKGRKYVKVESSKINECRIAK